VGDVNEAAVRAHVQAINDCNQRGGRMLSLVDLIEAGSVDLHLAAYLAAVMRSGASLLVGARPGGAGKTAVMCALLNFLPDATVIRPVSQPSVLAAGLLDQGVGQTCYLAHEIGAGSYFAYVWGSDARSFLQLAARGHIVASNLHADTLQETHEQLVAQNGVAPAHLEAVTLKLYLRMRRGPGWQLRRWVSHVYESDGAGDRLLWTGDSPFARHGESKLIPPATQEAYALFLRSLLHRGARRIEDVRRALIEHQAVGST
jgi:hypothetical protein